MSDSIRGLKDEDLLRGFDGLLREERSQKAQLLRYIDEIDRRQLWAKRGYSSMFDFCVRCWHMSESTAAKRIGAARAARRFPVIVAMVARGELHLSGLHRLKAHLTEENHPEVLAEAKHKTLKEIDLLIARLAPAPDRASRLRALPRRGRRDAQPGAGRPLAGSTPNAAPEPGAGAEPRPEPQPAPAPQPEPRRGSSSGSARRSPDPKPLSPRRYKLEVTIGEEARAKLEQLQGLLGHQVPDGDPAAIVERALDALLEEALKKKAALTKNPRGDDATREPDSSKRTIPARIRREVWKRDAGRCAFVGDGGRRCDATRALEFAHAYPWARGGEHSVDNVSLRCRAHNAFEASRDYGEAFMARKRGVPDGVREASAGYSPRNVAIFAGRAAHDPHVSILGHDVQSPWAPGRAAEIPKRSPSRPRPGQATVATTATATVPATATATVAATVTVEVAATTRSRGGDRSEASEQATRPMEITSFLGLAQADHASKTSSEWVVPTVDQRM